MGFLWMGNWGMLQTVNPKHKDWMLWLLWLKPQRIQLTNLPSKLGFIFDYENPPPQKKKPIKLLYILWLPLF